MGRFYKTAQPQFIDFGYQLPEDLMLKVMEKADEQVRANEEATLSLYDQLQLDALKPDMPRAREIVTGYEDRIDALAQQIQKDPKAFRRNSTPIRKLARDIHMDFTRGEAAAIGGNYAARQAHAKKLAELVQKEPEKFRPQDKQRLMQYLDANFKGTGWDAETQAHQAYATEDLVQYADMAAIAEEASKNFEHEMKTTYGASLSADGRWIIKHKNKVEFVPESDVRKVATAILDNDKNLNDYVSQQEKIGGMLPGEALGMKQDIVDAMGIKYGFERQEGQMDRKANPYKLAEFKHDLEEEKNRATVNIEEGVFSIRPYGGVNNKMTLNSNSQNRRDLKTEIKGLEQALANTTGDDKVAINRQLQRKKGELKHLQNIYKQGYKDVFKKMNIDDDTKKWYWEMKQGGRRQMLLNEVNKIKEEASLPGTDTDKTKADVLTHPYSKELIRFNKLEEQVQKNMADWYKNNSDKTQYEFKTFSVGTVDKAGGKIKKTEINKDGELTTKTESVVSTGELTTNENINNILMSNLVNNQVNNKGFELLTQNGESGITETFSVGGVFGIGDTEYALSFSGDENEKTLWDYAKDTGREMSNIVQIDGMVSSQYGYKPSLTVRFKDVEGVDPNRQYMLQLPGGVSDQIVGQLQDLMNSEDFKLKQRDMNNISNLVTNWSNSKIGNVVSQLNDTFQDVELQPGEKGIAEPIFIESPDGTSGTTVTIQPINVSANPNQQEVHYQMYNRNGELVGTYPSINSIATELYQ